jgi:catechol 2,3-dioxygenase-like lactoylglutathione lyase family enzyme
MTNLRETIDFYHSLLDVETARETHEQLTDQLQRRGLFFGTRPLSTVLRPRFIDPNEYRALQVGIHAVMPAFQKIHRAAMADAGFRAQFCLQDWEEELIHIDPGFSAPSPTSRMDTFFDEEGTLWLCEYNAETPAAIAYTDVMTEVYYGLPVMREFSKHFEMRPLFGRHLMMHTLIDCYRQWGGRERPCIAILDWKEVPTYSEFVLFHDYFESQGYDCVIADPREVTYENNQLMADGKQIHLIYKRVLISELVERGGLDHPVIRAVRDHAVCMLNPFRCKVLHKKASLAVLSDENNAHLFSLDEETAIQRYIPWTRLVQERHTVFEGETIDLLPFLAKNKDEFVLKPNDEYGGKGVVLGWEVNDEEWEAALKTALVEPSIVQKRVALPKIPYASWVNGGVEIYDRMIDTNPFIWNGNFVDGCLTRLSTVALLNVTAGGGSSVPTFVVNPRE